MHATSLDKPFAIVASVLKWLQFLEEHFSWARQPMSLDAIQKMDPSTLSPFANSRLGNLT
jgi:hypothetical protein